MNVRDVMHDKLLLLSIDTNIQDAAQKLAHNPGKDIVILQHNGDPAGIVTRNGIVGAVSIGCLPNTSIDRLMETSFGKTATNTQLSVLTRESFDLWLIYEKNQIVGILHRADFDIFMGNSANHFFALLAPVLECLDIPIIIIDTQCRVILANRSTCTEIKSEKSSILGQPITSLFQPSRPITLLKSYDFRIMQKFSLNNKTYATDWVPIRHDGKMIGGFAILCDITDYELMSSELMRITDMSKELNAIIDSSFDGIFVTDEGSITLKVNKAYERITGIKSAEVLGRTMTSLVADGVYDESATLKVLQEKRPVTIVQNIMKTGKTVVVTGNPIFDENGKVFRVVTNVRDVTELNLLQEKLKKMEQLQSRYKIEIEQLRKNVIDHNDFVIKSKKMKDIYALALKLAAVDSTILIQGDSGVGKEIFSEIVHRHGPRWDKPFVKISCAAIPENLLESELFGYASGAFTGAIKKGRVGVFELAHGGTIFLDEIGEMPISLQVKLLRVLQEREIVRIGDSKPVKVDIRIMAATNRNLEEMVKNNQFRRDLFFRINVVPVVIPPLRERKEAISHFISFFLKKHNKKCGFSKQFSTEAVDAMIDYDWPGNVRELENMVEQLLVMAQGEVIIFDDLPNRFKNSHSLSVSSSLEVKPLKVALEEFECRLLKTAIEKHGSSRKVAAALGIDQSTVVRKANRLGIQLGG